MTDLLFIAAELVVLLVMFEIVLKLLGSIYAGRRKARSFDKHVKSAMKIVNSE